MKVKFKKLEKLATMPTRAHASDAGFDLAATSIQIDSRGNVVYGTGLAVKIPEGYVGLVFPRSSICKQDLLLSNAVGIIDSGYRGEIMAKFKAAKNVRPSIQKEGESLYVDLYTGYRSQIYAVGDRIAQLIILPIPAIEFEEAEELSSSDRGEGGYGSTGR